MSMPPLSLKGRALRLLSSREHSRLELTQKLKPFEGEPGQLVRVLDELQAKGFIDEVIMPHSTRKRVARAFASLRSKKLTNPWKKHDNIPL